MYSGGNGTLASPYLIANLQDLNDIRYHLSANFMQTANITLGNNFIPIDYFTGCYNGCNYIIQDGIIDDTSRGSVGIFGYIFDANVQFSNIQLKNIIINGDTDSGTLIGSLRDSGTSKLFNITVDNNCQVSAERYGAGGIVGMIYTLSSIYSNNVIEHCCNWGKVASVSNVGGIVGTLRSGNIINCYNRGNICAFYANAGGIAGIVENNRTIQYCYNQGQIEGSDYCGGIVGNNTAYIKNCFSLGFSVRRTVGEGMNFGRICGKETSYESSNYAALTSDGNGLWFFWH